MAFSDSQPKAVNVLGIRLGATNMRDSVRQIASWIETKKRGYVCVTGVHGVMECQRSERVHAAHNGATLIVPDGMPLVYISRLAGHRNSGRVYGPDLMLEVCRESVGRGYKHFLYGTTPATLQKLAARLSYDFPGLQIVGSYSPPFRPPTPEEAAATVSLINSCEPDIVWVGLSTPKQECWMSDNRGALNAPVLIGVGAAFDFHAGNVRQAPRWMQPLCLEWLFRLVSEPRRLWKRYLSNNPRFLWRVTLQGLGIKQYN